MCVYVYYIWIHKDQKHYQQNKTEKLNNTISIKLLRDLVPKLLIEGTRESELEDWGEKTRKAEGY